MWSWYDCDWWHVHIHYSSHVWTICCMSSDTDMRMDGYETQLRLAPARDIWDGLAPASDLDADEIWFRWWYMVHVWPPWVLIWVFSADWLRQQMCIVGQTCITTTWHHYCILHRICLIFVCDVWIVSVYPSYVEFDLLALCCWSVVDEDILLVLGVEYDLFSIGWLVCC